MNKFGLLCGALLLSGASTVFGQGAKNIVINEVLTNNTASILDEFGEREAWIELENTSFTTYNIRGMYLTTDRSVLDQQMSVPDRIKRMSVIPSGDARTSLGGRQHIVFFAGSNPARGKLHLSLKVPMSEPVWIALYNGNAVELIDSVTVPALAADQSFARQGKKWAVKSAQNVTPGTENFIKTDETKDAKLKREDPHGFGITLLAMGIVFTCLAVLFLFFTLFGMLMRGKWLDQSEADSTAMRFDERVAYRFEYGKPTDTTKPISNFNRVLYTLRSDTEKVENQQFSVIAYITVDGENYYFSEPNYDINIHELLSE